MLTEVTFSKAVIATLLGAVLNLQQNFKTIIFFFYTKYWYTFTYNYYLCKTRFFKYIMLEIFSTTNKHFNSHRKMIVLFIAQKKFTIQLIYKLD